MSVFRCLRKCYPAGGLQVFWGTGTGSLTYLGDKTFRQQTFGRHFGQQDIRHNLTNFSAIFPHLCVVAHDREISFHISPDKTYISYIHKSLSICKHSLCVCMPHALHWIHSVTQWLPQTDRVMTFLTNLTLSHKSKLDAIAPAGLATFI